MYLMDPWFLLQPVATGFFSWAVGPLVAQWPKWMQTHPCCVEQRMEDIVSRFMKIKKPEQARRPDYREEQMNAESISARRTTSSVIEQSHIVGRDEELAKVRQFLLSSDGEDARISDDDVDDHLSVMAIVGMGGLGKTTLAQLAYNDDQVNQHFQLKSWVCVSEDFDVIQLTKAMLKSLNVEASGFSELDPLQRKLLQRLKGQGRLLLVLDDVWEADNLNIHGWNLLTAPLRNRSAGTNIIMTTRSRKVPEMVSRNSTYDLSFLSDEDTLELFMLHAFEEHCGNWASLPPLGQLPSLKSLYVSEAGAVEYIGGEFFSGGFPQLEELTLEDMYNWKSWCGAQEGDCPKLKKLSISSCENLESLSLINLGAVEDISISRCPKLRFMPGHSLELSHLQRAQTIRIQGIYKVWSIEAHFSPAAPLEDEQRLYLEDVGQREAEYMLGLCFHICRLTVRRCLNLTSLPLGNLITLEYVEISECPELRITSVSPQLQQVPSLQKIHNAEHITVLFRESHLQLENVDQLVASFLLKELSHMICRLAITRCANLTSLPLLELTALKYLKISECNQLQLSSGSLQLPQSSSMLKLKIQCKREAEYVRVLFSPGGTEAPETSCLELTNVDKLEALFFLNEFSHMIHRLTITQCANLTSLPLTELTALKYLEISECNQFQLSSGSLQLPQSSSMLEMKIKCICGAEYIRVLFSPGGTEALETSCLELTNVDQLEVLFLLNEFSHMIHRLTITRCANLTSLPWTDLTTIECLTVSECSMFQLLDAKQLPSTLQVLCIYGNPYETEQCGRHQHFQRLKQVQQCSDKEGGERNLYLVFRNVHDASAASKFCSMDFTKIHTLDIEWDCCTNDSSNVTHRVAQEVLFNLYSLCISSQKLVIRGYIDSGFTSWYAICFSKKLRTDFFRSRLSSVSLLQWSKCEILPPLGQVSSLKELYVKGASSLKIFMQDYDDMFEEGWQETQTRIAFPELQKLEFHDMPVWKGWLGTREGDFPRLRKLILKHCPKLRALPHLPPSLEEFELEACDELTSLSASDSPNRTNSLRSSKPFRRLSLSTSKGTSPILQHMSLTNCPLLLAWCEGNPRILVDIPNLLIDGVRVHTNDGNSISKIFIQNIFKNK
ncbi:hypothetical protein Taro_047282 [Colocasia esculenta]|uniref:NB-ARC domain-containing protein n=1 Tax=Colocasia esculenta TaxID=4460 RepID=A0A843WUX2_COLES|nr:hypothetical protein [Colocasia esculenta]